MPSVRAAMAPAAAAFYGDPTASLTTVGVTGTNGKTTTAFLVHALLEADGRQTGLLGTVKSVIGGAERPVERTTPEAIDLQRTFREMLDAGDVACAMEVSSHALELHRADAIHFSAAIFTNLTQDHLDFHGTMEDYFQAKRQLFADGRPGHAVINVDDPYGARLAAEIPGAVTFAVDHEAAYRASELQTGLDGSRFTVHGPDGVTELRSPLPGRFNVYNVLGAFAAVRAVGVPVDVAAGAIETAGHVPGRFQPVDAGQEFAVLVDYAHTPDSLENVLQAARGLVDGGWAPAPTRISGRSRPRRVRMRRRPRPGQAAADGRDRDAAGRPRDRHLRQPALRGPRRRSSARSSSAPDRPSSTRPIAARPSTPRSAAPGRATWS